MIGRHDPPAPPPNACRAEHERGGSQGETLLGPAAQLQGRRRGREGGWRHQRWLQKVKQG